jgi:hypothetical protein
MIFLGLVTRTVPGADIQLIEGLPSSYTPGQPVAFDVRLPAITELGSYNIDLVLESTSGTAGVDFFFDVAATAPTVTNYIFPSAVNFFDAVNIDSPSQHRITLTDFDVAGVNVIPGANDRVATVVFQTTSNFDGPLSVFVAAPLLILDTPNVVPTPVPSFDAIQDDIAAAGPIDLTPVPEPSTLYFGAVVLITIVFKRSVGFGKRDRALIAC